VARAGAVKSPVHLQLAVEHEFHHSSNMRRWLIIAATILALANIVWLVCRADPNQPEYILETEGGEFWFEDQDMHVKSLESLPLWDGKMWTLNGRPFKQISSELGKRQLELGDERCVLEYRLAEKTTYRDFLSAQRQAEEAGASVMIVTMPTDVKWLKRGNGTEWTIFYSEKHGRRCGR
jgi:hypothetical protein